MTLLIQFAWRFKEYIVIAIMVALLLFAVSSCSSKEREIKQIKTEYELQLTTLKANYVETARNIERQAYEQTIQAVNDAKEREQVIIADAASARDAVTSLSNAVSEISAAAKSDAKLRDRYIDTSSQLLVDCSSRYSEMGAIADRLSNNLRLSQEANRRK